ncbi:hypothetical protein VS883_27775, partial [Escherichia coli]
NFFTFGFTAFKSTSAPSSAEIKRNLGLQARRSKPNRFRGELFTYFQWVNGFEENGSPQVSNFFTFGFTAFKSTSAPSSAEIKRNLGLQARRS